MTEQLTTVLATGPLVPLPINNCPTLHLVPSSHTITLSTSSRHALAFCHRNSASCFPLPSLLQRYPPALPFLQLQRSRHLLPDSGSGLPVHYLNQSSFWFLLSLIQQIPLEPLFWARCWARCVGPHLGHRETRTSAQCSRNPRGRAPTAPPASLGSCPHPMVQVFPMAPHPSSCCPRRSSLSCQSSGSP